jgi:hypothetical protein
VRKICSIYFLAVLGFSVSEEAETGLVFIEALVEAWLLVPSVLVVVDVVVCFWIRKVELDSRCQWTAVQRISVAGGPYLVRSYTDNVAFTLTQNISNR